MAEITPETVAKIARLSRLHITAAEAERYRTTLQDILGYIGKLGELDTASVEPLGHILPLTNVDREDVVQPSLPVDTALAGAPDRSGDYYRVPQIIE
jgi:aspartyl-tRNA(Asn)/glutamyl-tRNA(Gln) amidotransferase subunit C